MPLRVQIAGRVKRSFLKPFAVAIVVIAAVTGAAIYAIAAPRVADGSAHPALADSCAAQAQGGLSLSGQSLAAEAGPRMEVANVWSRRTTESPDPDGFDYVGAGAEVSSTYLATDGGGMPTRTIKAGSDLVLVTVVDVGRDEPVVLWDDGDADYSALNGPGFMLPAGTKEPEPVVFVLNNTSPFIGAGPPWIVLVERGDTHTAGADGVFSTGDDEFETVPTSVAEIRVSFNGGAGEPGWIKVKRESPGDALHFDVRYMIAGTNVISARAYSDVNLAGVQVKLVETGPDTARFEGVLCLIEDKIAPAPGARREGDTVPWLGTEVTDYASLRVGPGHANFEYQASDLTVAVQSVAIDVSPPVVAGVTTSGGSGTGDGEEASERLTRSDMHISINSGEVLSDNGTTISVVDIASGDVEWTYEGLSADSWSAMYVAPYDALTGDRAVTYEATDLAGNVMKRGDPPGVAFRLDRELIGPITDPPQGTIFTVARPSIRLDFAAGGETTSVQIDALTLERDNVPVDVVEVNVMPGGVNHEFTVTPDPALGPGSYRLLIPSGGAHDVAGNFNADPIVLKFSVAAPTPTITPVPTVTPTAVVPTAIPTPVLTPTAIPPATVTASPTATPTVTSVPPTASPTTTAPSTAPVAPTATPTVIPVPPIAVATLTQAAASPTASSTPSPTGSSAQPRLTATSLPLLQPLGRPGDNAAEQSNSWSLAVPTFLVFGAADRRQIEVSLRRLLGSGVSVPASTALISWQGSRMALTFPVSGVVGGAPLAGGLEFSAGPVYLKALDGDGFVVVSAGESAVIEGRASVEMTDNAMVVYVGEPVLVFRPMIEMTDNSVGT